MIFPIISKASYFSLSLTHARYIHTYYTRHVQFSLHIKNKNVLETDKDKNNNKRTLHSCRNILRSQIAITS